MQTALRPASGLSAHASQHDKDTGCNCTMFFFQSYSSLYYTLLGVLRGEGWRSHILKGMA